MSGPTPEQIEEWRKQATALHKFSPERAARHAFALAYAAGVEQGKAEQRERDAPPTVVAADKRAHPWPFTCTPGQLSARLAEAHEFFDGNMLAAVRNVFIEGGQVGIRAADPAGEGKT